MKIKPIFTDKDAYEFKIDDVIIFEFGGDAVSVLKINLPSSIYAEEYYESFKEQFDIEKMIQDLLKENIKIKKVVIDSKVCRIDGEIVFQTKDLEKYKK